LSEERLLLETAENLTRGKVDQKKGVSKSAKNEMIGLTRTPSVLDFRGLVPLHRTTTEDFILCPTHEHKSHEGKEIPGKSRPSISDTEEVLNQSASMLVKEKRRAHPLNVCNKRSVKEQQQFNNQREESKSLESLSSEMLMRRTWL